MGKYIIDIDEKNICSDDNGSQLAISVKVNDASAIFCTEILLTPYTEPDMEQVNREKEEQIQVGDEIETPSGLKGYVVNFTDDELVHYVSSEGRFGTVGMSAVSKTGRHFPEIAEALAKMKES